MAYYRTPWLWTTHCIDYWLVSYLRSGVKKFWPHWKNGDPLFRTQISARLYKTCLTKTAKRLVGISFTKKKTDCRTTLQNKDDWNPLLSLWQLLHQWLCYKLLCWARKLHSSLKAASKIFLCKGWWYFLCQWSYKTLSSLVDCNCAYTCS